MAYLNITLCFTPARLSRVYPVYYIINNYNVRQEIWVRAVWEMAVLFLWERVQMKIAYIVFCLLAEGLGTRKRFWVMVPNFFFFL
jgi:hypothetical protein